jgi:CheY-like chemotaxis protein
LINIEVLKNHFVELGLAEVSEFCINGQDTIDAAKKAIDQAIEGRVDQPSISPIDFMLLDFQMPRKNGFQVLKEVKDYYALKQSECKERCLILEPVFVFLTAFATTSFRQHVLSLGVKLVFEKPI